MKWKLISKQPEIVNRWIKVTRAAFQLARGTVLEDYWLVERSDFVVVVGQSEDKVILVKEYRPAMDRFYLSPPAGYIDSGESPLGAAAREFQEETGMEILNDDFILRSNMRCRAWGF